MPVSPLKEARYGEYDQSLDLWLGIIVAMGIATTVSYHLQEAIIWLRRVWMVLAMATGVAALGVVAVALLGVARSTEISNNPQNSAVTGSQGTATLAKSRNRTFSFERINDHCAGPDDITWHVVADDGWKIDVTSIEAEVFSRGKKSSFSGLEDVTSEGFTLKGRLANHGSCIKLFGQIVARDGRGSLRVDGSYTERRAGE